MNGQHVLTSPSNTGVNQGPQGTCPRSQATLPPGPTVDTRETPAPFSSQASVQLFVLGKVIMTMTTTSDKIRIRTDKEHIHTQADEGEGAGPTQQNASCSTQDKEARKSPLPRPECWPADTSHAHECPVRIKTLVWSQSAAHRLFTDHSYTY